MIIPSKNNLKLGIIISVGLLFLYAPTTYASDVTTTVNQTGPDSNTTTTTAVTNTTNTNVVNTATANTGLTANIVTGGLNIINNTTVGDVSTSPVNFNFAVVNQLNNGPITLPSANSSDPNISTSISNTGPNSTVNAITVITQNHQTQITNTATANTPVSINIISGPINVANNTTVGFIKGGVIAVSVNLANFLNSQLPSSITPVTPIPSTPTVGPKNPAAEFGKGGGELLAAVITPASAVTPPLTHGYFPSGSYPILPLLFIAGLGMIGIIRQRRFVSIYHH